MVCAAPLGTAATAGSSCARGCEGSQLPPGNVLGYQRQLQMDVGAPGRDLGAAGMRELLRKARGGGEGAMPGLLCQEGGIQLGSEL